MSCHSGNLHLARIGANSPTCPNSFLFRKEIEDETLEVGLPPRPQKKQHLLFAHALGVSFGYFSPRSNSFFCRLDQMILALEGSKNGKLSRPFRSVVPFSRVYPESEDGRSGADQHVQREPAQLRLRQDLSAGIEIMRPIQGENNSFSSLRSEWINS